MKDPNVLTINEVGFKKNKKVNVPGYYSFTRNRKGNVNMGGIAKLVKNNENSSALKVVEGEDSDEFMVTRHGKFKKAINVKVPRWAVRSTKS